MNWNDLPHDVKEGLISDFTNIAISITTNTNSSIKLKIINPQEYQKIVSKLNLAIGRNKRFSKEKMFRRKNKEITELIIDTLTKYGAMSLYQLSQHTDLQLSVIKNFVKRDSSSLAPKIRSVKQGNATYVTIKENS
tara:strand:- start:619 stop:1026 length:408 start_codon:yes stop_codon:yes gene_type:complete